jgi:hypothetical protein
VKLFNKSLNLIKIFPSIEGLCSIPEILPQSSQKFFPSWWKELPVLKSKNSINDSFPGNVKTCPSFPDYLSQGVIIPMWTDTIISFDKNKVWRWKTSNEIFQWEIHYPHQFLDSTSYSYMNKKAKFIFKAICPWHIITPPGYSVYQLPLFYHQQDDYSVLPGIIDTDIHHIINQQVVYHTDKFEIFIKRGTPFVQYIPFKRTNFKIDVHEPTKDENKALLKNTRNFQTTFLGSQYYAKLKSKKKNNE